MSKRTRNPIRNQSNAKHRGSSSISFDGDNAPTTALVRLILLHGCRVRTRPLSRPDRACSISGRSRGAEGVMPSPTSPNRPSRPQARPPSRCRRRRRPTAGASLRARRRRPRRSSPRRPPSRRPPGYIYIYIYIGSGSVCGQGQWSGSGSVVRFRVRVRVRGQWSG